MRTSLDQTNDERAELHRDLFDEAPVGLYRVLPDGEFRDANLALADLLGVDHPNKLLGRKAKEFYLDPNERQRLLTRVDAEGAVYNFETRLRRADGSVFTALISSRAFHEADGAPLFYRGAVQDVTERRRMEDSLTKSEERFRTIFETSLDAITVNDVPSGRYVEVNDEFLRTTGYRRDEVLGRTPAEIGIWERREDLRQLNRELMSGRVVRNLKAPFRAKDGTVRWALVSAVPLEVRGQQQVISFVRDVTDQERFEEGVRRTQKMEVAGRIASGITHDMNNVITVIRACVQLGLQDDPKSESPESLFREIDEAAEHAGVLNKRFLGFARQRQSHVKTLDPDEAVEALLPMLRRITRANVRLDVAPSGERCFIQMDPGQLEQVVLNLVINACDALPEGGTVVLRTRCTAERAPSGEVVLEVEDDGPGIPEEVQKQLFTPFFTTKEEGKGTGLGLATCRTIVDEAGGSIEVDSQVGRGSTFRVRLPRVSGDHSAAGEPASRAPQARGDERILIVDDEEPLRRALKNGLEQLGYTVMAVVDPEEAMTVAASDPGPDVLIVDFVLPLMSGLELARRIEQQRPGTKILLVSAYGEDPSVQDRVTRSGYRLLGKPFDLNRLAHELRAILVKTGTPLPSRS